MNNNEKTDFILSAQKYLEDHKIYDLFEHLTKQLLLKQPQNSLDFLIDRLSNPNNFRLFFVCGALDSHSNEISQNLASEFNFKYFSIDNLVQEELKKNNEQSTKIAEDIKECRPLPDDFLNKLVLKEINSVDQKSKGLLINGYPRTLVSFSFSIII